MAEGEFGDARFGAFCGEVPEGEVDGGLGGAEGLEEIPGAVPCAADAGGGVDIDAVESGEPCCGALEFCEDFVGVLAEEFARRAFAVADAADAILEAGEDAAGRFHARVVDAENETRGQRLDAERCFQCEIESAMRRGFARRTSGYWFQV